MANVPLTPHLSTVPDQEYTADPGTVGCNFTPGESSASKTYNVSYGQFPTFLSDVLGWSQAEGSSLHRSLPKQHPEFPWMYASRVTSLQGIGSIGNVKAAGSGITASYRLYRCVVQFETPPYVIAGDGGAEYTRFTIPEIEPASEVIQRKQGTFLWSPSAGVGSGLLGNTKINDQFTVSQRLSKMKLSLTWVQVPDKGLFGGSGSAGGNFYSKNIQDGVGSVNLNVFLGFPPGTLLLTGWRPTARTMPVPPGNDLTNLISNGGSFTFPRAWDVRLDFVYFNPQPSGDVGASVPGGAIFGHNLVPHPYDGKWYAAYVDGIGFTSSGLIYQYYDFEKLFELNT